jgi:hypothetical protein
VLWQPVYRELAVERHQARLIGAIVDGVLALLLTVD